MAKAKTDDGTTETAAPPAAKRKRFGGGDYDLANFGQISDGEYFKDGVVASADVRAMLDELGLSEVKHIQFPLHQMKRRGSELWSLRIEALGTHHVKDQVTNGHHWVYKREQPESVAGNN
jgi:hypothetical protein